MGLRRYLDAPTAVTLAAAAACSIATLRLAYFVTAVEGPVGFDDGYIAAFALRLMDGRWLPYVDAVSLRGPVLYWTAALFQSAWGAFDWTGQRVLVASCHIGTLMAIMAIGIAVRRLSMAVIAASLFVLMLGVFTEPGAAFGLHGEPLAMFFGTSSVAAVTWACAKALGRRTASALLVVGGVFAALTGLTKTTAFPVALPLLLAAWLVRPVPRAAFRFLVGCVAPLLALLAVYAAAGELSALRYWLLVYPRVHMAPFENARLLVDVTRVMFDHASITMLLLLVLTPGVVLSIAACRSPRALKTSLPVQWLMVLLTLQGLIALGGALVQQRFWAHHFLPLMPYATLLAAMWVDRALETEPRIVPAAVGLSLALFTVAAGDARLVWMGQERQRGRWPTSASDPMCDVIAEHARADQGIIIWGFDGDLYMTCRRRPLTRFVFSLPVAGVVPPFWNTPSAQYVARDAPRMLAHDIESGRPALVLDMPTRVGGVSLEHLEPVDSVLRQFYCKLPAVDRGGRRATPWIPRSPSCPPSS